MQLLKFELYKIFKQKSIYFTFIGLLLMSYLSLNYPYSPALEKEMYKQWEGAITEEKIQQAKSEYAVFMKKEKESKSNEEEIYSEEVSLKIWMLQKIILSESVENHVAERLHELKSESNIKANLEEQMLKKIGVGHFSHHTGPAQSVSFVEFGAFIVIGVMLLIGLSAIYSKEYSTGVDHFIFSSKNGRKALAWAKIVASLSYTFIVVMAWELFNLIVNLLLHGKEGWSAPIQLITLYGNAPYAESPYAFSMLDYHLIQLGIHLIGALSFSLLIVLISSLCKNSLTTFFIGMSIFILPEFLNVEWLRTIVDFSFISIVRVQFLFEEFKTVDIFGYPILYPVFACFVMLVLAIIFIRFVVQIIKHKEITS